MSLQPVSSTTPEVFEQPGAKTKTGKQNKNFACENCDKSFAVRILLLYYSIKFNQNIEFSFICFKASRSKYYSRLEKQNNFIMHMV